MPAESANAGSARKTIPGGLVAVVMRIVNGFIAGIFVVGVDLEGFVDKEGVQEIKARILIPSRALVNVGIANHQDAEDHDGMFADGWRLLSDPLFIPQDKGVANAGETFFHFSVLLRE